MDSFKQAAKNKIKDEVFAILEDLCDIPRENIDLNARLVEDLKVNSDDLSFVYAPQLQKRLNTKIPIWEWGKIHTVKDTIELFEKYHELKYIHRSKGSL